MKLWLCRTISHALDPLVTGYLFSESSKCLSMMIADNTTWKNMTFIRNYIHISYNFVLCSLWNSFAIQNLPEYIFLTPFHCQQIRPSAQFSSKNRLLNVVKLFLKHEKILVFKYLFGTKGQMISKRLFGVLEFSQITNKQIRCSSKNEFVRLFFGRIRGYQKSFWNYLTFGKLKYKIM